MPLFFVRLSLTLESDKHILYAYSFIPKVSKSLLQTRALGANLSVCD